MCFGACSEQETSSDYNERVLKAVQKYSTANKNILIVDKGREIGEYSAILIKNGIFKGMGYYDLNHQINNIHILESIITPMTGNATSTHIIESYLRKKKVKKIVELNI